MPLPAARPLRRESRVGKGRVRRPERLGERVALLGPGLGYSLLFLAVPLGLVAVYAFLTAKRFGRVGGPVTLANVQRLTEPLYRDVAFTSLKLAAIATVIALLIGYPAAYALSRLPRRWRTVGIMLVVIPFWTNFLIRTYAWIVLLNDQGLINKLLGSLGIIDSPVQLMNHEPAIVLGFVYAYLPLMILPLYASIERLDPSLVEAAGNLGATPWQRFVTVILPMTAQGAVTGSLFVMIPSLGNFVIPELLGGGLTATLGTVARDQYLTDQNWPFGSAIALMILVVIVGIMVFQSLLTRRFGDRS